MSLHLNSQKSNRKSTMWTGKNLYFGRVHPQCVLLTYLCQIVWITWLLRNFEVCKNGMRHRVRRCGTTRFGE